jgi:tetratricopeptide (TPR) repeat protein
MRWLRLALSAAIAVAALAAIHRWCYVPLWCDVTGKAIEKATRLDVESPDRDSGMRAHRNLEALRTCLQNAPGQVPLYMLAAANSRILGSPEEAISFYEMALRYDRRPEIYANIGECQLMLNRKDDAVRSFVTAGMFSPEYIMNIADFDVRMRVDGIVAKQRWLPWHRRPEEMKTQP